MARKNAQAYRGGGKEPKPAWVWLVAGVLLGLGLSGVAMYRDWVPTLRQSDAPRPDPAAQAPRNAEPGVADQPVAATKPKYDFYSVLPEMEVVIPESEVSAEAAKPPAQATPATGEKFFLQTGSFKANGDAEQMKARLALMGLRAQVVSVDINGQQWHRVRVGPYATARELDEGRRTLQANGLEAIALKDAGG